MSTLHKFKAYFGMVPLEDYEDDYLEDPTPAPPRRAPRTREPARPSFADRDRYDAYYPEPRHDEEPSYRDRPYQPVSRHDDFDDDRYAPPRRTSRPAREPEPMPIRTSTRSSVPGSRPVTRGALAVDPVVDRRVEEHRDERRAPATDDGGPLSKITTLRPRDYSEARTIGERFRDGSPVIMDLVELSNADAKRVVDFAAGLVFALRGSFDKVATKVFLLSPADIDVSAEECKRIAETGFYNQR